MNFAPISGRTVCALHCVLAMLSSCMSPLAALAAPPTNINPAPLIQNSYQVTANVADSSTCAPQCIVKFQTVPKAKQLVIRNVSAQLGQNLDSFVIEGNGGAFFVQKGYPTAGNLDAPIMVYFEAGSIPTARFFVQDATQHISLVVTFIGYIIPLQ